MRPLGEVMRQIHRPVAVAELEEVRYAGVRWYSEGVYERAVVPATSVKASKLNRIREGDIVYNRMWATKSSFGVVREDADGCLVTNDFPIFQAEPSETLADYVGLLFHWEPFRRAASLAATGTTERRRLNEREFVKIKLAFPPLAEQQRIVDVIGALDDTISAADAGIAAGSAMLGPLIDRMLASDESWPQRALGEVGGFIRGKRFTKSEYVDSGLGCIHYGQLHTHFGATATEAITFLPPEAKGRLRLAEPGDVVIAATSENVEDLGNATAWLGRESVAVHDDCYIWKHNLDPVFASYVFASPAFQDQKIKFAAGMKVTRISGASLAKIRITIPPPDIQEAIGVALRAADAHTQALRAQRSQLRTLRSNLLSALLSGEHEIPESYDELMEEAVA